MIKYKNKIRYPEIPLLLKVQFSAPKKKVFSGFAHPLDSTYILQPPKTSSLYSTICIIIIHRVNEKVL